MFRFFTKKKFDINEFEAKLDQDKKELDNMLLTKNDALLKLAAMITDTRIKPVLDNCIEMKLNKPEVIKYNPSLDDNDYLEFKAKLNGKLIHL